MAVEKAGGEELEQEEGAPKGLYTKHATGAVQMNIGTQ